MAVNSSIEWTEATWNLVAGCAIVSPGCTNCYAMRMAARLEAIGQSKYKGTTRITGGRSKWNNKINIDHNALEIPMKWRRGRRIFVNSMSDLFHEDVPVDFITSVFDIMARTPQHTYQVLTKRSHRLSVISEMLHWPKNVWIGVSVESSDFTDRIDHLRVVPAHIRFLSLEPLLGPLEDLNLNGIDWVIVGGESGPGARAMRPEWVHSIRDQCVIADVAFHFKQWGGVRKKIAGRLLDGREWNQFPTECRVGHTSMPPVDPRLVGFA